MLISIKRSEHAKKLLLHSMLNPTKEQLKNKLGVKSGYRKLQQQQPRERKIRDRK